MVAVGAAPLAAWRRLWRPQWAALAGALALLAADGVALGSAIRRNPGWRTSTDFGDILVAIGRLRAGQSPYPVDASGHLLRNDVYPYPPAFAEMLLGPAWVGGAEFARFLWLGLTIACLLGAVVILLRGFYWRVPWPWVLMAFASLLAGHLGRDDLYHGQANFFLLFGISLGLLLIARRARLRGAAAWGVVAAVKPFLGVLFPYLAWKRQWRAAALGAGVTAGLLLLSLLPFGGRAGRVFVDWIVVLRYYGGTIVARPDNHSLAGFLARVLEQNPYMTSLASRPELAEGAWATAAILLLGLFAWAVSRDMPTNPALLLVEASFILALYMTLGPLTEGDHLFLLLPGLVGSAVLWRRAGGPADRRRWLAATVAWSALGLAVVAPVQGPFGISPQPATGFGPVFEVLWSGRVVLLLLVICGTTARAVRGRRYPVTVWRPAHRAIRRRLVTGPLAPLWPGSGSWRAGRGARRRA